MLDKKILFIFLIFIIPLVSSCGAKANDPSLSLIKKKGKIVVGTYANLEPMTFKDKENNIAGHDIDLIKEVAKKIGVSIEFKDIFFPDMLEAVKRGEVDVAISAITITPQRSEEMLFSNPYFSAGQVIIVKKETKNVASFEDLYGEKIGVLRGTTGEKEAKKRTRPSLVISYDDGEEVRALLNNEIAAIIHDYPGAGGIIKNNPTLKLVGEPFTQEYYGIATKKENASLMNEINKILKKMEKKGKIKELHFIWFNY